MVTGRCSLIARFIASGAVGTLARSDCMDAGFIAWMQSLNFFGRPTNQFNRLS